MKLNFLFKHKRRLEELFYLNVYQVIEGVALAPGVLLEVRRPQMHKKNVRIFQMLFI